ncbi:39S ribosomal protein L18, mitochondrial-like [Pecten maximus]|uniref:39S ribosomal protein L18, mitochondrial-like n=1 Tax=Pecten maximus TaxID=6579 RepID=UPI001458E442|nr:39S ribosomal protein L18, mitochondrial-like [Pecten maximus]
MALMVGGRLQLPLSTGALTCICRSVRRCSVSASESIKNTSPNADYEINPQFRNRNPRNLEKMALARKTEGWKYQQGARKFYHQLSVKIANRKTTAIVRHSSGTFILKVSTDCPEMKQTFSGSGCNRVTRAHYLGQIIAQRCLEAGITHVDFEPPQGDISPSNQAFLEGLEKMKLELTEPDVIKPTYRPGIDYSVRNRYAEPKIYRHDYQVA